MSNPYEGLISTDLKLIYYNLMEELIRGTAVPCTAYFQGIYTSCTNCTDSIGNKPTNRGSSASPTTFRDLNGCRSCDGTGKILQEVSEDLDLALIRNPKDFIKVGTINIPDGAIQSISRLSNTFIPISTCKYVIMNTDLSSLGTFKYEKVGPPIPAGFDEEFLVVFWKRI